MVASFRPDQGARASLSSRSVAGDAPKPGGVATPGRGACLAVGDDALSRFRQESIERFSVVPAPSDHDPVGLFQEVEVTPRVAGDEYEVGSSPDLYDSEALRSRRDLLNE